MEEISGDTSVFFILLHNVIFVPLVQFPGPFCLSLHVYVRHTGNDTCLLYPYIEMLFYSNHLRFAFMFLTEEYTFIEQLYNIEKWPCSD